jgi:hypothetical protein
MTWKKSCTLVMSLNGLVRPAREKCESANWRWVRAHQLAPQGLGPEMDLQRRCNYGSVAPYTNPQELAAMERTTPFRVWGYPNVTQCSRLGPLLYAPRVDPNPPKGDYGSGKCNCGGESPQWPYGFYCGKH